LGVDTGANPALLRTSLQGRTRRLVPRTLAAASHQLIESRHIVPGAPVPDAAQAGLSGQRPAQAHARGMAPHLLFPWFQGLGGGSASHASRNAMRWQEIWVSRSTKAADGGIKPETAGSCSVSSAPSRIAFQRVKGARRTFSARAPPVLISPETFIAKAQLQFSGLPHARMRSAKTHCLQVSQT
jgi:hypothetical protein